MMDRRSLLKRLGVAGLAIPAAMLVEKKLVLPPEEITPVVWHTIAEIPPSPHSHGQYFFDGVADALDVRIYREPTIEYPFRGPLVRVPDRALLHLEMVVLNGGMYVPQIQSGDRIRVTITPWGKVAVK